MVESCDTAANGFDETQAAAHGVDARPGEQSLGLRQGRRPVLPHQREVALESSRRQHDGGCAPGLSLTRPHIGNLDAAHAASLHQQPLDLPVPAECDVGIVQAGAIDGSDEAQSTTSCCVDARDAVAVDVDHAVERDAERREPVEELGP
jgi:hypothetical protein